MDQESFFVLIFFVLLDAIIHKRIYTRAVDFYWAWRNNTAQQRSDTKWQRGARSIDDKAVIIFFEDYIIGYNFKVSS